MGPARNTPIPYAKDTFMANKKKTPDFEASVTELEALVTSLENNELSLEESLSAFEKGIKLTRECQQQLSNAEQKVAMLTGAGDNIELTGFEGDDAN